VRSISVEEMDSILNGTKIEFGVSPISILVNENSKCSIGITEVQRSSKILIPLENNLDYFSRYSFMPEITCSKTNHGSDLDSSSAVNLMAL